MPLSFKGIAHPPPRRDGKRHNAADMSGAEIATANLGKRGGTDLLYEHDQGTRVGHVTSSWEGPRGELRVSGIVTDAAIEKEVRNGQTRGLSLGQSVITGEDGQRVMATTDELSLCDEPRRGGCYVTEVDGKSVHTAATFSKKAGAPLTR